MAAGDGSCCVNGNPPRHSFASQHSLPCNWCCLSGCVRVCLALPVLAVQALCLSLGGCAKSDGLTR